MLIDFALFVNGKRYAILLSDSLIDNKKDLLKKDGWRMRRFTTQDLQNDLAMVIEEITRLC
jgi:very-short-patch-repair endonuclease